jgi:uncharacterized protein DUF5681
MSDIERNDFKTRFKKGQSGNPEGRPKKEKSASVSLRDAFLKTVRVRDGQGTREVPKIVAALEVCLNNALKGDLKSFVKIMEVIARHKLLDAISAPPQVTEIRRTIVDPKPPPSEPQG